MIKETDNEGNTKYTYPKCKACGSDKLHFKEMSEKAIKAGSAKEGFVTGYEITSGIIGDPDILKGLPLGSETPSIRVVTDICKDCGSLRAVMVRTGKEIKQLVVAPPTIHLPGQN